MEGSASCLRPNKTLEVVSDEGPSSSLSSSEAAQLILVEVEKYLEKESKVVLNKFLFLKAKLRVHGMPLILVIHGHRR